MTVIGWDYRDSGGVERQLNEQYRLHEQQRSDFDDHLENFDHRLSNLSGDWRCAFGGTEPKKPDPITPEELDYLNAEQLRYMVDRGDE
jgi:hypothetical protein